jgi:hypothetical protein
MTYRYRGWATAARPQHLCGSSPQPCVACNDMGTCANGGRRGTDNISGDSRSSIRVAPLLCCTCVRVLQGGTCQSACKWKVHVRYDLRLTRRDSMPSLFCHSSLKCTNQRTTRREPQGFMPAWCLDVHRAALGTRQRSRLQTNQVSVARNLDVCSGLRSHGLRA